jgi:hypothetical protein
LIGRGTGELYPVSSGLAGWMQNGGGGDNSMHHDQALFEGGAFETWGASTLASNAVINGLSNSGPSEALRHQASHGNMSG